jgi:histone H3/H4
MLAIFCRSEIYINAEVLYMLLQSALPPFLIAKSCITAFKLLIAYNMRDIMYISESSIKKILKEAGASRISKEASSAFHDQLNRFAFEVASKAVRLAKHAKRKTVAGSDIKLAFQ